MRRAGVKYPGSLHFPHTSFRMQVRFVQQLEEMRIAMGACTCTYTRDEEKNCDGTHKVVKAVKAEMAEKLEANGFPHAAEYVRSN
jgi:hypothetical protein